MREHYERHNANVARSVHTLGTEATEAYEGARAKVAAFIGAPTPTRWCSPRTPPRRSTWSRTPSQRLAAPDGDPRFRLGPGDEIVISEMEHHSNIVPWQLLCERTGATLRWFGITDDGRLDESDLDELVNERTKIVSLVHVSNILGTVNATSPHHRPGPRGRRAGACSTARSRCRTCRSTCVDCDVDFIAFTGHKMLGPTGIGVLWGRRRAARGDAAVPRRRLDDRDGHDGAARRSRRRRPGSRRAPRRSPRRSGSARRSTTSPRIGMEAIQWHEKELTAYALDALPTVPGLRIFGPTVAGGPGRHDLVRARRHPPARRRARCSTPRASQVRVGPPLRPAGLRAVRRAGDDPGVVLPLHHHGGDRRPGARAWSRCGRCSPDAARPAVPGDHPGPLQAPARARAARAVSTARGAPRQPDLRRRGRPCGCAWPTATVADVSYDGHGLLDQPGLGERAARAAASAGPSSEALSRCTRRSSS